VRFSANATTVDAREALSPRLSSPFPASSWIMPGPAFRKSAEPQPGISTASQNQLQVRLGADGRKPAECRQHRRDHRSQPRIQRFPLILTSFPNAGRCTGTVCRSRAFSCPADKRTARGGQHSLGSSAHSAAEAVRSATPIIIATLPYVATILLDRSRVRRAPDRVPHEIRQAESWEVDRFGRSVYDNPTSRPLIGSCAPAPDRKHARCARQMN
jgi:hypothetical protein